MKDIKCNFCYTAKDFIIDESEYSRAYIFATCLKLGHFVVAPKEHIKMFAHLNIEQLCDMMKLAKHVSQKVQKLTKAEKIYIAAIGDSGNHFHIHFMPKMKNESPLGTFIFSDTGWKGKLPDVSKEQLMNFAECYKKLNNSKKLIDSGE